MKNINSICSMILGIFVLWIGYLILSYFMPTETKMEVTDISWECNIQLEKLVTVEETDDFVPTNGREKYSNLVYRYNVGNVPIYETEYTYDIERWFGNGVITTQGNDHSPYWGEIPPLNEKGEPPYNVGAERVGGTKEIYRVTGILNGKEKTYTVDRELWETLNVGDKFVGVVQCDHLKKVEVHDKVQNSQ